MARSIKSKEMMIRKLAHQGMWTGGFIAMKDEPSVTENTMTRYGVTGTGGTTSQGSVSMADTTAEANHTADFTLKVSI